jgi:type 1 glutamine amidotransferase
MSRSRSFSPGRGFLAFVAFGLASINSPLLAQFGGLGAPQPVSPHGPSVTKLKEPTDNRVYQRDANDRADISISLPENHKAGKIISAQISGGGMLFQAKLVDSKVVGLSTGGPYTISCQFKDGANIGTAEASNVYVGDLWVLAGQSNMEGVGDLVDVTQPHPQVMLLGMNGEWSQAEEPLHWLVDSPDPVHSGESSGRATRAAEAHKTRQKGAGLGLPFASALAASTGVPIGLVACAHGGTSMEQWNPAHKGQGGNSLYGSMLRQVSLAGGKVKGVLWYQGESDSLGDGNASKTYSGNFTNFIAAVRSDFGQPELPFYFVQIGRFVFGADPKGWNAVQESQRQIAERVPNTAVISVIDLELDDAIHVGTQGLKRAGHRLARIAQRELFGQIGATTPSLDRVTEGPNNTLVVKFKGVNMRADHPSIQGGIAGGRLYRGGMGNGAMGAGPTGVGGAGGGLRSVAASGFDASGFDASGVGLRPERHIAGFSIRKEDGTNIPLIFEACIGKARDTVILKLSGPFPEKASLWYGYGLDPFCNLTDSLDMAVPVFGPIALDEVAVSRPAVAGSGAGRANGQPQAAPIQLLIITGDHGHVWKDTTAALKEFLGDGGRIHIDVTTTPSKDLTDANLSKYDVLLLNYKDTPKGTPESRWSEDNKTAFLKAVHDGKGLVVFHHASSAFTNPNWDEFEKAIAGGWRSKGFHGPKHVFNVKKTDAKHPISEGQPGQFEHAIDELYQNSVMVPGSVVLATAYSDPKKPRGTDKDEPVIWVNTYGKGRVYENVLGHDTEAMADPNFRSWMRRGVIWAATGKVD